VGGIEPSFHSLREEVCGMRERDLKIISAGNFGACARQHVAPNDGLARINKHIMLAGGIIK
jgi:hypothetical protein